MATGKQMYELGLTRVGCKYSFGVVVPKDDKNYMGAFDCAEFASWDVYQVSGLLYGCTNDSANPHSADAYSQSWIRDAKNKGQIISVNEGFRTPGAVLARVAGADIIGHAAISSGTGKTVEAHSTKTGLIQSVVTGRRWDYAIQVPWITYTPNIIADVKDQNKKPTGMIYRLTSPKYMRGPKIKAIQKALKMQRVDGIFGPETFNNVRAFQIKRGLVPDGEVGPKTWAALKL